MKDSIEEVKEMTVGEVIETEKFQEEYTKEVQTKIINKKKEKNM